MVEADHIPPKDSVQKLRQLFEKNPRLKKSFKDKNPEVYKLVMSMKTKEALEGKKDLGKDLLCMNTLYKDHRSVLTTGNSTASKACRCLHHPKLLSG